MPLSFSIEQLSNGFSSISTYADMSPDLLVRHQVNQSLKARNRQTLSLWAWGHSFCRDSYESAQPVLLFVYEYFSQYSGLEFGRVRPEDTLNDDLLFPLVCWFDWAITFCEDFYQQFDVDLSDYFDEADFETIGELVIFLVEQVNLHEQSYLSETTLVASTAK